MELFKKSWAVLQNAHLAEIWQANFRGGADVLPDTFSGKHENDAEFQLRNEQEEDHVGRVPKIREQALPRIAEYVEQGYDQ